VCGERRELEETAADKSHGLLRYADDLRQPLRIVAQRG
jgi:hypothetical protein